MAANKFFFPVFVFVSLVFVIGVYWWGYQAPVIGVDDANIYFVYMRNFAEGHGFVWNVGGERVEGFTSLIWTLFGAMLYYLSPEHFNILLLLANFTLVFSALHRILHFSERLNGGIRKATLSVEVIIVSLLVLPLGFVEWSILALMETGLWTFIIIHLTLDLCKLLLDGGRFRLLRFSGLIALLVLTRPEGMALGFIFVTLLFIVLLSGAHKSSALRLAGVTLGVHVITLFLLLLWRLSYFGYPFPNTYYAKVSGSVVDNMQSGVRYLFLFFDSYPHAAFITALLVLFAGLLVRRVVFGRGSATTQEKCVAVLLAVIFAGLALPVFTGGDHFKYSRFYQPYLPLIYLAGTSSFLWKDYIGLYFVPRGVAVTALVFPVVFSCLFLSKFTIFDFFKERNSVNYNILNDFSLAQNARRLAEHLNETFGDHRYPSLGALATGSIGYSYNGKTIDLLGLNNTTMAHANPIKQGYRNHASFDKGGFWKLAPDVLGTFMGADIVRDTTLFVLPENTRRYRTSDFTYQCFKGIFDDPEFREAYEPALVQNRQFDYFIFGYYKTSFLDELSASGGFSIKVLERKPVPGKHEFNNLPKSVVTASEPR